ncbi:hypothetical protein [Halobaculum gomorrense]|uniref:Uncharacterized protein n=1 Tax=Halobaculum gomorrense TaxID=43928 RepID=A0A1M5MTY6_9EURY|nr:hypothetical protein [Halobaculum gomorrense]SHG80840.1 hypothetical protein SAMN05443636_1148 [Halobaculum gomorrense]
MSLRHAGATLFGTGLLVCTALLVTVGPAAATTLVACPGPERLAEFAVTGVRTWPPTLTYTDGCNAIVLRPSVLWSAVAAAVGLALAGVGQALVQRT